MKILKVKIEQFRNLKNIEKEFDGDLIVYGNNKLGKTNFLNAIYWCLLGITLDNKENDGANIPFGEQYACVLVETDKGKIERYVGPDHTQIIKFNGMAAKKKVFEETFFGRKPKKEFNENRFLMNPNYITQVAEKNFRAYVVSKLDIDLKEIYNAMNETYQEYTKELLDNDFSIERVSTDYDAKIKEAKATREYYLHVLDFLNTHIPNSKWIKECDRLQRSALETLELYQNKTIALNSFALEVSRKYQEKTNIAILEKRIGENVWKEIAKPLIPETKTYYNNGSTAEKIIALVSANAIYNDSMPILIDETETLDSLSTQELKRAFKGQIIVSKVVDGTTELSFKEF